ncbi:MAG: hypothetical protein Q9168_003971 [Polycauliona sp. 1 TL-2023]
MPESARQPPMPQVAIERGIQSYKQANVEKDLQIRRLEDKVKHQTEWFFKTGQATGQTEEQAKVAEGMMSRTDAKEAQLVDRDEQIARQCTLINSMKKHLEWIPIQQKPAAETDPPHQQRTSLDGNWQSRFPIPKIEATEEPADQYTYQLDDNWSQQTMPSEPINRHTYRLDGDWSHQTIASANGIPWLGYDPQGYYGGHH